LKTCITGCGIILGTLIKGEEQIQTADKIKSCVIAFGAAFILGWSSFILWGNRENLYKLEVEEKFGKMYLGINKHSKYGILYFPVLLLRLLVFIMISSLFYTCAVFQVQLIMILNTLFTIWYYQTKPHLYRGRSRLQMFHESTKMIEAYHLMLFTNAYSTSI